MFRVFKTENGDYRWIGVSSSAFEDRTGETVATKAIDYSIKTAKGNYGELRIYHLPGTRVGICDNSLRIGMFLIESGIFDNTETAEQVRSTVSADSEKYGLSIGFRYRPCDLVDNCYEKIKIFERSIVEEPDAAALFTNIRLMSSSAEVISMEKKAELINKLTEMLGGNGDLAQDLLEQASKIGIKMQAGEELGLKEDTSEDEPKEEEKTVVTKVVIEPEIEEKVAEDVLEVKEPAAVPIVETSNEDVGQKNDFILELDLPTIQTLAKEIAQRIPAPEQKAVKAVQEGLATMQKQLDAAGEILNHLLKSDEDKLAEMQKQLPRMRLAYRPSNEQETITEAPGKTVAEKAISEAPVNHSKQSLADSIQRIQEHRHAQVSGVKE